MENVRERGGYLNAKDIKEIVESHIEWADVVEGQVFCAKNIMSENTPIGTSIIVGVDGIKCDENSDIVRLILSSGIYEIPVKTESVNDVIDIRFDKTLPIPGTFGEEIDGVIDILTDEEKKFKDTVDHMLENRNDEYAELFRRDYMREIGGRGIVLLEKAKAEIKNDDILSDNDVTPYQLISTFVEITERYVNANETIERLNSKHDNLLESYRDTYEEGSKRTKKLARDIEMVNRKIDSNHQIVNYCLATINAAILPVMNMELCK